MPHASAPLSLKLGASRSMDDFSKSISEKFKETFPSWAKYCCEKQYEDTFVLEVKIPRPINDGVPFLALDTCDDEVTVSFDSYHAHFSDFGNEKSFDDALNFINKIISEKYAMVSYSRGTNWCGSELIASCNLPQDNSEYPYADTLVIRSWNGSFDQEIECFAKN